MGPYNNNGYVLADRASRECYLVDAPAEIPRLLTEASGMLVKGVLITHTHPDHIAGYADLMALTELPVAVHPADAARLPGPAVFGLNDGDVLQVGSTPIQVLHTPGHTPGGVCLLIGDCLISGDTLFPGGPGYTRGPEAFEQVVRSITEHLYALDSAVKVFPGHGGDTTIGDSKIEYTVFTAKARNAGLHGEVHWLTS